MTRDDQRALQAAYILTGKLEPGVRVRYKRTSKSDHRYEGTFIQFGPFDFTRESGSKTQFGPHDPVIKRSKRSMNAWTKCGLYWSADEGNLEPL